MKIKMRSAKAAAVFLAAVMLSGCLSGCGAAAKPGTTAAQGTAVQTKPEVQTPDCTEPEVSPTGQWAEKMNVRKTGNIRNTILSDSFDGRFLAYISAHAEGNYMVSPLSFRYALGLLLAGAEGETRTELLQALGVSSEEEWIEHCLDFNGFVETFAADLEREREEHRYQKEQGWIPEGTPEPEIFRALRGANAVWKAERIAE